MQRALILILMFVTAACAAPPPRQQQAQAPAERKPTMPDTLHVVAKRIAGLLLKELNAA